MARYRIMSSTPKFGFVIPLILDGSRKTDAEQQFEDVKIEPEEFVDEEEATGKIIFKLGSRLV